ncbi:MAG: hypothetical protein AMS24_02845 [Chlamydiae bacterium SM23_39]|nr:MAG: hypothetical protein AMS24_02845 [Chlamydiae bacterium SM23_39]
MSIEINKKNIVYKKVYFQYDDNNTDNNNTYKKISELKKECKLGQDCEDSAFVKHNKLRLVTAYAIEVWTYDNSAKTLIKIKKTFNNPLFYIHYNHCKEKYQKKLLKNFIDEKKYNLSTYSTEEYIEQEALDYRLFEKYIENNEFQKAYEKVEKVSKMKKPEEKNKYIDHFIISCKNKKGLNEDERYGVFCKSFKLFDMLTSKEKQKSDIPRLLINKYLCCDEDFIELSKEFLNKHYEKWSWTKLELQISIWFYNILLFLKNLFYKKQ